MEKLLDSMAVSECHHNKLTVLPLKTIIFHAKILSLISYQIFKAKLLSQTYCFTMNSITGAEFRFIIIFQNMHFVKNRSRPWAFLSRDFWKYLDYFLAELNGGFCVPKIESNPTSYICLVVLILGKLSHLHSMVWRVSFYH